MQACAQLKVELSRVMESDMCIDDMFDGVRLLRTCCVACVSSPPNLFQIDFETSLTRKEVRPQRRLLCISIDLCLVRGDSTARVCQTPGPGTIGGLTSVPSADLLVAD